jgi:hypothetical protein
MRMRTHWIETGKPLVQALVRDVTGAPLAGRHDDFSTVTGEALENLTLAEPPPCRLSNKTEPRAAVRLRTTHS